MCIRDSMRTIVVGDMHQKQHPILPIVDSAIRLLGARRVVLLGDYCDDYSPNRDTTDAKKLLEGLEFQADWIDRTRGRGIQVDVLQMCIRDRPITPRAVIRLHGNRLLRFACQRRR